MTKLFGVDVGGILIDRANDRSDTSFFGARYLESSPVPDALESIVRLARAGIEIVIVSKCGATIERKTREWLAHRRFHEQTGIGAERLRFCRERADKAAICRELGVTHFVDDRLEVLSYLETVPHLYLMNANPREVEHFSRALPRVRLVSGWLELTRLVLEG